MALYTVMDIETTDFLEYQTINGVSVLSDKSEILEVGYLNFDSNTNSVKNYGTLYFYKPYFDVEHAQHIHGLTREFLQQYEADFDKNLIALCAMLENATFVGKNNDKFDYPFLMGFIKKHAKFHYNLPNFIDTLGMKTYDGKRFYYDNGVEIIDVQVEHPEIFRARFFYNNLINMYRTLDADGNPTVQNTFNPFKASSTQLSTLTTTKKGTLTQYIDYMPNGRSVVDEFYSTLSKDRVTGAHGALYDCVMTFVAYLSTIIYYGKPEFTKNYLQLKDELGKMTNNEDKITWIKEQMENCCPVPTMIAALAI